MKSVDRALMGVASAMMLAAAAYAQPTPTADLGVVSPGTRTGVLTGFSAGQVKWLKFTIAGVTRLNGDYLDIDTNGGTLAGTFTGDSYIGFYNNTGARLAFNDDSGPGSYSMISFGATSPTRPGLAATGNAAGAGLAHAGASGADLAPGVYWLAVTGYPSTMSTTTPWGATSTHNASGDVAYVISYQYTAPGNPIGVGGFTPASIRSCDGGTAVATVTVTPGSNPASTGLRVKGDLSALGGSTLQDFFDNGTNGDATAGDNIFSYAVNVPAGTTVGNYAFGYTVSDLQGRSTTGTSTALAVNLCPQANNAGCSAAQDLTVGVPTPGALISSGSSTSLPACGVYATGSFNQNWYRFIGTGNTMTFTTCNATGFDTIVAVYCGVDGCGALTCVGANDDATCSFSGLRSTLSFCSVAGAPYYAIVRGYSTNLGNYVVTVNDDGTPCNATIACGQPTNPVGAGSLGGAVQNCGDQTALVRVTVTPGAFPVSTGVTVVADASGLGGSATLALNDTGANGDATAGDNIFSARVPISYTVDAGVPIAVPFTVTDAQSRSTQGTFNATIDTCTVIGACCLPDGCQQLSRVACEGSGGSYIGNGVLCDVPPGYAVTGSGAAFEDISGVGTAITQGDDTTVNVPVGFDFTFYGDTYNTVNICSNGFMSFNSTSTAYTNTAIPAAAVPNAALYPMWDDFNFTTAGQCYYATIGTPGTDQRFIAQWTNVPQFLGTDSNSFQAVIYENGSIEFRYGAISAFTDVDATVGIENADGTVATSVPASSIVSNSSLAFGVTSGGPSCSSCPPCAADYNMDGGVDGGDIATFFGDWEAGTSCSDVNLDGGTDGADIETFFSVWQAGGC